MTAMSPLLAHRDPGLRLLMCTHIYQEKWKEPGKRKEKERKPKRLDTPSDMCTKDHWLKPFIISYREETNSFLPSA